MPCTEPNVRIRSRHRQWSFFFFLFCQSLMTIVDLSRRRPARPAVLGLDRAERPDSTAETRRKFQRGPDLGCPAHLPAAASPARCAAPVPSLAKSSHPSVGTLPCGQDRRGPLPLLRGMARATATVGCDCEDRQYWHQLRATASAISGSQRVLPSLTIRITDPSLVLPWTETHPDSSAAVDFTYRTVHDLLPIDGICLFFDSSLCNRRCWDFF